MRSWLARNTPREALHPRISYLGDGMRESIDLDGRWKFYPAFDPLEGDLRWMDPEFDPDNPSKLGEEHGAGWRGEFFDDDPWLDIEVPGSWNSQIEDLWSYEGHGYYRRSVRVPSSWRGRRVVFDSEGANYRVELYVNGKFAGDHEGGHMPFSIPIRELLHFGAENVIAVDCDNVPKPDRVPGGQFGWWNHGGLYRDVRLTSTDTVYVDDVKIEQILGGRAVLRLDIDLVSVRTDDVERDLFISLTSPSGAPIPGISSESLLCRPGRKRLKAKITIDDPELWSPESPALYDLRVQLREDGDVIDEWFHRIGLRQVEVKEGELLLNGKPVLIRGLNRHEQYADGVRSRPTHTEEELRRDLELVRGLGANALRCHYPNHRRLYELCDEMGILNMVELPLWQWGSPVVDTDSTVPLERARFMLREMIGIYRNHPSVVFWSVSNENFVLPHSSQREDPEAISLSEEVVKGNVELMELARRLDPSRPVVEVSCMWPRDPAMGEGDLLAINAYVGSPSPPLAGQVHRTYDRIHEKLEELMARHPGKPILVTEFGKWTVRGLGTTYPPGELYQAEKFRTEWEGFIQEPGFVGGFIWCFADYDVHLRYRYTNEYRLGYGVFDLRRRPKAAVDAIREAWKG